MKETKLNEVLNYMKQYVENKYEHDSEPMLTYKDLQLVLEEIERLNKDLKDACVVIERLKEDKKKAIEYIDNLSNEPNVFGHYGIDGNCKNWLLNILKGSDKE